MLRFRRFSLGISLALVYSSLVIADERPNILFIFADDHAYQAIGAYGSRVNQTPNIDRIATEGMRFDRCFVTNSICGPSRAVILTGKYSHLNGFVRNGNTFNGHQQTLPKLLGKVGYETAVIGKWHLKSDPIGFDYYHVLIGQGPYYNPPMKTPDGVVEHIGYTTDIITDEALSWLKEKRDRDKPFLLMYQHKAPHRHWQPGPKYLTKYDGETIPEPETLFDDYSGRGSAAKTQEMTVAEHLSRNDLKLDPQKGLTEEQTALWDAAYGPKNKAFEEAGLEGKDLVRWKYQRYVKDYLRCVDAIDENVGRVLDYLDESGLDENTIVIYSSDQGWYLGEHGWYDKRWMYEESFRTPLLVRWPGKVKPGSVNTDMVMNLDFPELFLDVAGAEIPADMQGKSFKSILQGNTPSDWRKSVYYHYYEFPGAHSVQKHYGVRTDRYKLIRFYEIDEWELYDLEADPNELNSVYDDPKYASIVKEMKQELDRLQDQYQDDGTVVDWGADLAKLVKLQRVAQFNPRKVELTNGATVVEGRRRPAIKLSGQGAALTRPSNGRLDPEFKPITVGAWCKLSSGDGVIVAHGGAALGYSLYLDDGTPVFAIRDSGQLQTIRADKIVLNEWTHVAVILDADGEAQLFINGEPASDPKKVGFVGGRPADSFAIGADPGSLIGEYDGNNGFSGLLEDVRVYWGVLDEQALSTWAK